jgi:nitroimidazol reductase NimA-like FMN-containing flavoprotein (pyridoxamine 5'-phosphate oxidase superfamily)
MENKAEYNKKAHFTFEYVEKLLRTKNFGILSTVTDTGQPHSVGVVYAMSPQSAQSFSIYLLSRMALKKVKNISNNPNVAFVVPFPHNIMRMILLHVYNSVGKLN